MSSSTASTPFASAPRIVVLMPLRDDWASAAELIRRLDRALSAHPCNLQILIVDDGSVEPCDPQAFQSPFSAVRLIRVLRLRRNLGHQRGIASGLVHIETAMPCDAVLVMDADGEDTPEGALQLVRAFTGSQAIFAERSRRTESLAFRSFYILYKAFHLMLTGVSVRVGNFSILPSSYLCTLTVMAESWNHYAAAVFRSGLPFTTTPIPRGYRLAGTSRMNFVSLAAHGMSAISVFGDVVGVRLLIVCAIGIVLSVFWVLAVAATHLFTKSELPAWTGYSFGTVVIILVQLITMAISFTFTMLSNRINFSFVPLRDSGVFVAGPQDIYRHE